MNEYAYTDWKFEIMIGKLPAKTSSYSDLSIRSDIIKLYHKIDKIKYISKYKPSILFVEFLKNGYAVDNLYEIIMKSEEPVSIIYLTNQQLRISITTEYEKSRKLIIVKIPVIENW